MFSRRFWNKYLPVNVKGHSWSPQQMAMILAKTEGHCYYCGIMLVAGRKVRHYMRFTVDHLRPLSKGGRNSRENTIAACSHCNCLKNNHTLEQMRAKYRLAKLLMISKLWNRTRDRTLLADFRDKLKNNKDVRFWFEEHPEMIHIPAKLSIFTLLMRDLYYGLLRCAISVRIIQKEHHGDQDTSFTRRQ